MMCTRTAGIAILLLLVWPCGSALADTQSASLAAAGWLESSQANDGSWGADSEVRGVHTASAVDALRAYGAKNGAYHAGLAWIENHALSSVDFKSRRVVALSTNGDDVSDDLAFLFDSFSFDHPSGNGWGISQPYIASSLDTAQVLLAQAAQAVPHNSDTSDALNFLIASQHTDGGWRIAVTGASDKIVTASVLLGYSALWPYFSGYDASGNAAAAFLLSNVSAADSPLIKALATRAVLAWYPGTIAVDGWIASLEATQLPNGSWGDEAYATAEALHALSSKLGRDSPTLQANVPISDLGLRAAINSALGKNRLDSITRLEMQSLTALDASNLDITDLSGIEEAINLTWIDLSGNYGLTDLTPLDAIPGPIVIIPPAILCDVNQDGTFSIADPLIALRASIGDISLDPTQTFSADVAPTSGPGDGVVNSADVSVLMSALSGQVTVCDN